MPPPPERALASSPVPAPASPSEPSKWSGAVLGGDGPKPTIAELAIIAGGSFLLVLVIGALLIRFVL
jgi:hypothetical protein